VRAGDRVELRPPGEILATLDAQGSLDGVPFMPEMLGFFERTLTIEAQVARACDTVNYSGVRRLRETVLLDDLRCDGSGHAGCQAGCRLYWKEAWLRPATKHERHDDVRGEDFVRLEQLVAGNVHGATSTADVPTFRCQATELLRASEPVGWWNVRSFVHELTCGNVGPFRFVRVMTRIVVEEVGRRLGLVTSYPFCPSQRTGRTNVSPQPAGLRPGELVQIRPKHEIARTLDEIGKHRGLWFDREMLAYCGRTASVRSKVERFIDEGSGRMVELASDCYILDGVVCQSYRSAGRWFCPRAIYPFWRECWLRRLEDEAADQGVAVPAQRSGGSETRPRRRPR